MTAGYDLRLVIDEVLLRPFRAPPPAASAYFSAVRFADPGRPSEGWLVGVRAGEHRGWWGPVGLEAVELLRALVAKLPGRLRGTPGDCAKRLRRTTRHAHTGMHSIGIGALELACWDALGQRHGVPVWRLLRERPLRSEVASYATCFGIRLDHPRARDVVLAAADVWTVQKWRPVCTLRSTHGAERGRAGGARRAVLRTAQAAGPGRLALDFGGVWPTAAALRYAAELEMQLAFIEEPAAPGALYELNEYYRPAPLAAGEHCYHPDDAEALASARIDVWQPDAVFCGGLTALIAISSRADAAGWCTYPHGGGLSAAVHAATAGVPLACVEFHLLLEPRRQAHYQHPLLPRDDGWFAVPELPGWAGPLREDLNAT